MSFLDPEKKKHIKRSHKILLLIYILATAYSLRTVYDDLSISVHHKYIQTLTTEGHKILNEICPTIMKIPFI